MTRETKFKAIQKQHLGNWEEIYSDVFLGVDGKLYELVEDDDDKVLKEYSFLPYKVLLFTGLKDKEGVEIYKDDIIQREGDIKGEENARVEWDNDTASFVFIEKDGTKYWINIKTILDKNIKVIGNIYSNPDLLKTKVANKPINK